MPYSQGSLQWFSNRRAGPTSGEWTTRRKISIETGLNGEYLQREKNSLEFADATVLTFISLQFNLDPFYG